MLGARVFAQREYIMIIIIIIAAARACSIFNVCIYAMTTRVGGWVGLGHFNSSVVDGDVCQ